MELKQNAKSYNELATKLSNVEHRHVLLTEEKQHSEEDFKRREEEQTSILYSLKTETDSLKNK